MKDMLQNFNIVLDKHPRIIDRILDLNLKKCISHPINKLNTFPKELIKYFNLLTIDFLDVYFSLDFAKSVFEKGHEEGYHAFRQPFESHRQRYYNVYTRGGQTAHRGYFCPLPNPLCKIGHKCSKKSMEQNLFDYKFWFCNNELVRVEKYQDGYHNDDKEEVARTSDEFIFKISPSRTIGFHYNTMCDVELNHVILCEYDGGRLVRYVDFSEMRRNISACGIRYEEYDYSDNKVTTYEIEVILGICNLEDRIYRLISY